MVRNFFVCTSSMKQTANRYNDIETAISSVEQKVSLISQNINEIGLAGIDGYFDSIKQNLSKNKTKLCDLHYALNKIINIYTNTEDSIVNSSINISGTSDINTVRNLNYKNVCGTDEYDLEKVKELMQKNPEDLTEEELIYLMNAILQLDADDMDEFMLASLTDLPEWEGYLTGSDNAFAAMLLCKYELYDQLINSEITEDEYISQIMKITMMESTLSEDYYAMFLNDEKYKFSEDPNDDGMYDSTNPASWTEEIGDCYHSFWRFKYDWERTVRYMGDGSTANITVKINHRYDAVRQNNVLNLLVKNTAETLLLAGVSSNPVVSGAVSVGYGTVSDYMDSSGNKRDMSDMINTFDLNVIETETTKEPASKGSTTDYTVVPGTDTQDGIDKFNDQISDLRNDYIDTHNRITLKGDHKIDVMKIANDNEFITLGIDSDFNLYVTDIKEITVYDIINCPNKVNELYYVVNLLEN